jgi:hypothetical protein
LGFGARFDEAAFEQQFVETFFLWVASQCVSVSVARP